MHHMYVRCAIFMKAFLKKEKRKKVKGQKIGNGKNPRGEEKKGALNQEAIKVHSKLASARYNVTIGAMDAVREKGNDDDNNKKQMQFIFRVILMDSKAKEGKPQLEKARIVQ
ncbi:hypothetical protein TWF569_002866 [Orbilia oligospora]|uniref:Uncharacterized protein n=1 Tax=Orbilia oligospora TaxID=2813651 RepID=A0A7C8N7S7_ORBOL|nr:hypothetical protein TWF102_001541 [Orbilia oligospora]KAF3084726.1 hypothetical protein TWF103_002341 [Orbilia oligospora]KAF3092003.1 hypothetical protein TWF706_009402 [Orbilia oligospora]KAF3120925.1 hypothetical protein TWF569_002866 [Orbilia oligospora]KAF3125698.1 hypothetical protein TWF594_001371 [Orbilia oligospora]